MSKVIDKVVPPKWHVKIGTRWMSADYDYDRTSCTSDCDSICRCTRLTNTRVNSIDVTSIELTAQHNGKAYKPTLVEQYCFDRIKRINKMYDASQWRVDSSFGYYGEEVTGVEFEGSMWAIEDDVKSMIAMQSPINQIKYVLEKEYSYLIDSVKRCTNAEVVKFDSAKLMTNDQYFNRVKVHEVSEYKIDSALPIGIIYQGRLIDGYHRTAKSGIGTHKFIEISE